LSPLQRQLYDFVDAYWREFGFAPTYEAILLALGLKYRSQIHYLVQRMLKAGTLEMRPGKARSIRCIPLGTREWQDGYRKGYTVAAADLKKEPQS
jgi:SOS-response transcriptional repressor LexA